MLLVCLHPILVATPVCCPFSGVMTKDTTSTSVSITEEYGVDENLAKFVTQSILDAQKSQKMRLAILLRKELEKALKPRFANLESQIEDIHNQQSSLAKSLHILNNDKLNPDLATSSKGKNPVVNNVFPDPLSSFADKTGPKVTTPRAPR